MSKTIETLIEDIDELFTGEHTFNDELSEWFSKRLVTHLIDRITSNKEPREPTLRLSNLGTVCQRKLWYDINQHHKAEPISNDLRRRFLFGDMYEEFLLWLCAEAGHSVEGTQGEVVLEGVKGHRDAVIDGMIVDIKSASPYGFKKFKEGLTKENDSFGYITQLQAYLAASQDDPVVTEKHRAAFLAVDKVSGEIAIDFHDFKNIDWEVFVRNRREMLDNNHPPARGFSDYAYQGSGNRALAMECSYCHHKEHCWPGLRTFLYKQGNGFRPVHMTKVVREPNVTEVTK
jgi:hypothetical protein